MKKFTIIIPIYNESESIFKLINELIKEFKNNLPEILVINDGSTDDFIPKKKKIREKEVSVLTHTRNLGKCKAILTGVLEAKNNTICVIDGDGQNPPYEIKNLIKFWDRLPIPKKKFGLVCGNRIKRQDTILKKVSSKIANRIRRFILDDDCNDTACALKVFFKSDYVKIQYFKNMHRFLPALFKMNGGIIYNIPVDDRPRNAGVSKYSFNNRFWVGITDLIKVWFLKKRRK
ncbi:MAG: glycosyltransferase [Pseudomonadota bacterium]|nr:glycosyltransferase [Pseudomonadota bacterium]